LEKRLPKKEYKYLSLAPENNRIVRIEPESPLNVALQVTDAQTVRLQWERGKQAKRFVVYKFRKNKPVNMDNPASVVAVTGLTEITLPCSVKELKKYRFGITALSPSHTESAVVFVE
jgi:DMSO/TMAO reductase YedYZ molybdopterin-dependent catalytic subunit